MSYDAYSYLWPPRPEDALPLGLLGFYEARGWWAQVKKNGTCTVIFARGDEVIFKTRHNDDHKQWTPLPEHRAIFSGRERWNVYVAELLHNKTANVKQHLYVFDVLVSDGEHLVGRSFALRHDLLRKRFPPIAGIGGLGAEVVGAGVSVATCLRGRFLEFWSQLRAEDEGLVLKDPSAPLKHCITPDANRGWQVKCRRSTKNYSF